MAGTRRSGRPTVGERVSLGLRVTPELKRRLDAAAEQSGRSQSQEAELRLERSFDRQELLAQVISVAHGDWLAGLLIFLADAMGTTGRLTIFANKDSAYDSSAWMFDVEAFDAAVRAATAVFNATHPTHPSFPSPDAALDRPNYVVRDLIHAIGGRRVDGDTSGLIERNARLIRRLLGPTAARMGGEGDTHRESDLAIASATDEILAAVKSEASTLTRKALTNVLEKHLKPLLGQDRVPTPQIKKQAKR